jgi:hypothetical protein
VTVYVHAWTQYDAECWAREQGYKPREFRAFGNFSHLDGMAYLPEDRVVLILNRLDPRVRTIVERNCAKSGTKPELLSRHV